MERYFIYKSRFNKTDLAFTFFAYIISGFLYSYFLYFMNRVNLTYDWSIFPVGELPVLVFSGVLSYFWSFLICVIALTFFSMQAFLPKAFKRYALEISLLCFWFTVLLFKNFDDNGSFNYEIFRRQCDFINDGSLTECGRQNLMIEYWANVLFSAVVCIFVALIRNATYGRMAR